MSSQENMKLTYPHLGSIPDFNMTDLNPKSAYNLHLARELLMIASKFGLDFHYKREKDGLTPEQFIE